MALLRRETDDQTFGEYGVIPAASEPAANRTDSDARAAPQLDRQMPIQRPLFVADAAVADVHELPARVRAVLETAAEVYVVTPTLPGLLAWLADDVDRFRHVADERLDSVLGHLRSINDHVSGDALRGRVMTVITDAVETFKPDHIMLALRSSEHANWQEHGLVEHVEKRFALPVTSFAIDSGGHVSPPADTC